MRRGGRIGETGYRRTLLKSSEETYRVPAVQASSTNNICGFENIGRCSLHVLESCEDPATARVKGTDNGRAEGPEHAEFDWMCDCVTDASTSRVVVTCQSHALRTFARDTGGSKF